jgi:hypothetical protein
MTMTRRPARSSFTFEIKRANRRTPEVLTISETSAPAATPLADQVFGKSSERSRPQKSDHSDAPIPARRKPMLGTVLPELTEPPVKASPPRVLPDLLTAGVDPGKERLHQEANERSTRRSTSRVSRTKKEGAHRAATARGAEVGPAAVKIDTAAITQPLSETVILSHDSAETVGQVSTSRKRKRKRKRNSLIAAHKRAKRDNQTVPDLPVGQRWKRRLPKACR